MRVYISGPMSGIPDENRPAFAERKYRMLALGFEVVNPPDLDDAEAVPGSYETRLERDVDAIKTCTHITYLPGSLRSRGAITERVYAESVKKLQEIDEDGHPVPSMDIVGYIIGRLKLEGVEA